MWARSPPRSWPPVRILRRQLLLLVLAVAVLFALVAYHLAASMSRPIEQLAGAMRGIERGERTPVLPGNE